MRKIESITLLDGKTFTVQQLPARAALKLMRRLGKVFAPALATFGGKSGEIDPKSFGNALEKVFDELSDDDLDHFTQQLLAGCLVDDKAPVLPQIDLLFQGRTFDLVKLLVHAVRANYQDFLGALRENSPLKAA
jgi:hypothetical protein